MRPLRHNKTTHSPLTRHHRTSRRPVEEARNAEAGQAAAERDPDLAEDGLLAVRLAIEQFQHGLHVGQHSSSAEGFSRDGLHRQAERKHKNKYRSRLF